MLLGEVEHLLNIAAGRNDSATYEDDPVSLRAGDLSNNCSPEDRCEPPLVILPLPRYIILSHP
jgi:hypothetical protein